jgi:PHYB activation tagged suppressor 1
LITRKITQLIKARIKGGVYGDDLLGMMVKAHRSKDQMLSIEDIIGEYKTMFAAGQDTGANLLTWAMFLLSSYPQWQEKLREEVRREYRDVPIIDNLGKLKLVCAQVTYAYNTYKYKFSYLFAHTNAA